MATQEELDRDAMWPEGTDVSGLCAMCQGLLSTLARMMAVYVGTSNAREVLRAVAENDEIWHETARVSPDLRAFLRQQDAIGKAMDDAEKKTGGGN
jgi:hypothetical protein